jgi:hypothetical protein
VFPFSLLIPAFAFVEAEEDAALPLLVPEAVTEPAPALAVLIGAALPLTLPLTVTDATTPPFGFVFSASAPALNAANVIVVVNAGRSSSVYVAGVISVNGFPGVLYSRAVPIVEGRLSGL